jgi:hypothetical protein
MTDAKPSPDQIALELSKLIDADLNATLAVLSGMLQSVRESDAKAVAGAKFAATALRLELGKWHQPNRREDDRLKSLREAGAAAAKK